MSNESDVACLLNQIDTEYQAANRALRDFSQGSSQHAFITQKMENMRILQEMIAVKVGDEMEAAKLVCEQLDKSGETK